MEHDDVLAKIDATLEALFPPDDSLDRRIVELILRQEIDDDGHSHYADSEPDEVDDPFGLYELHAIYAEWIRRRGHLGVFVVYGIEGTEVVFVAKPVAYAIDAALPRIVDDDLDWETFVPWVDQDQDEVLPTRSSSGSAGTTPARSTDSAWASRQSTPTRSSTAAECHGIHCAHDDDLVRRAGLGD